MNEQKSKFKKAAIAAWKANLSLESFLKSIGNPYPDGEKEWRLQYQKAGSPFGNEEKGFAKFVREFPG